jgi:iron complex outermembrane recepter protein
VPALLRVPRSWSVTTCGIVASLAVSSFAWADAPGPPLRDLSQLSLEELAQIEVSSVSKAPQPLSDAPAAIYVITHEDAVRAGATSLAEILRLAPNLQVARVTAYSYAISARGFNGTAADKLLVLIDGRSVYTPFSHGVSWDAQDPPAELIERVEVISGPGASLWGANAVNGVINVVTRRAPDTAQGSFVVGAGDESRRATLQFGGPLNDSWSYRLHASGVGYEGSRTAAGLDAKDGWPNGRAAFAWTELSARGT